MRYGETSGRLRRGNLERADYAVRAALLPI